MKILIVQTSFLGDTVLSTPVIAALKDLHPGCELWMMTTPASASLVQADPLLAGVITYDKRGRDRGVGGLWRKAQELRAAGFATVYSLHRSYRTALLLRLARIPKRIGFSSAALSMLYNVQRARPKELHEVERNLAILNAPEECSEERFAELSRSLRLFVDRSASIRPEVEELTSTSTSYVVLVPGSVWPTKRWSWRRYKEVVQHFTSLGMKVVLLGAEQEKTVCRQVAADTQAIDLSGLTTLQELLWMIRGAALVICNDSMALHVASAFTVPTVAVFCATSPTFGFGPWSPKGMVVEEQGLECKPCRRHGSTKCPTGTELCMQVSADKVLRAAEGLVSIGTSHRVGP